MRLKNTIFVKLLLSFWGVSSLIVLTLIAVITATQADFLEDADKDLNKRLNTQAKKIIGAADASPSELDSVLIDLARAENFRYFLIDSEGHLFSKNIVRVPKNILRFQNYYYLEQLNGVKRYLANKDIIFGPLPITIDSQTYEVWGSFKNPDGQQSLPQWHQNEEVILVSAIIFSGLIYAFMSWHIGSGLRQLRISSMALAKGDMSARPEAKLLKRSDEIGQLASSFNTMADSITRMITNQKRLIGDVSHELRTPLTRLQLAIAIANKKGQNSSELNRIQKEAEALEDMIQELLQLSKAELFSEQAKQNFTIADVLEPLIDDAIFEAEQLGKHIEYDYLPFELMGYPGLLSHSIENIIRNALKYANSCIKITTEIESDFYQIRISDDGPGVDANQLHMIFKPFYRPEEDRDRNTGGIGLGLAISKSAIDAHKGLITALNNYPSGLCIIIRLPVN
ncbi:ATP-binding protein [Paraferrimonas sp. SM1919]|uniref:ATP-binding protein n=1 Tax=Paraferrimonas sp. SM1919 TaxID=2662263 RepID=UPI0013D25BE3|nr:ATP-binding protein [Paraferrimonas sp. SM1919]